MKYLLGIDCGSTIVKAALFDENGHEISVVGEKIPHLYPHSGWTENDPEKLWQSVLTLLSRLLRETGIDPGQIAALACTGYGNGLYLTDAKGTPVRNGIISSDLRARDYVQQWLNDGTLDALRPKTLQATWPAQPNALLRFLLDHEPESVQRARWFFTCKDYIRFRLTGHPCWELSDATGCNMVNVTTGEYDDAIFHAWGLEQVRDLFPPLCHSLDLCGTITDEVAKATGLLAGTPVAAGMFDIDACSLAAGMTDPSCLCMVSGTWGNNLSLTQDPRPDSDIFMTSRYALDGYYLLLEGSPTSASNFDWFATRFLARRAPQAYQGESDETAWRDTQFAECLREIAAVSPREDAPIFLPYLFGGPVDLDARGVLFGLDGRHEQGDILRAVLEGIVFGHHWHVDRLCRVRNRPVVIRLTGGATRSPLWTQMFADVFQTPVEIPTGTELGVLGAAIGAAAAVGLYPSLTDAVQSMVRVDRVCQPNSELAELYARKYRRFRKLLDVLAGHWTLD
ncbi:MAG: FGGY-family carbohydrate kinase [Planctomycetia bacterium]|nr:FGGY-family carbohydrate kinase [Planctomycetia bacterium]